VATVITWACECLEPERRGNTWVAGWQARGLFAEKKDAQKSCAVARRLSHGAARCRVKQYEVDE
jgi:hypothetical protein